jgi:hypothetical protein
MFALYFLSKWNHVVINVGTLIYDLNQLSFNINVEQTLYAKHKNI